MTSLDDLPLRDDLRGGEPYGAPQLDVPYALNTNENPYPPSERLVKALGEAVMDVAGTLNRYPDRDAVALREDLAAFLNADTPGIGLTADRVWAANGSNEILQQILMAFGGPGRAALGFEPSYSMHPIITAVSGTRWIGAARDADFGIDPARAAETVAEHRPDVVFLTSPNNPTGTALPIEEIERFVARVPRHVCVLIDEAYCEFNTLDDPDASLALAQRHQNVVLLRTFSKVYGLAALRCGYALCGDERFRVAVEQVRQPFFCNSVAQAAAQVALERQDVITQRVEQTVANRLEVEEELRAMGLEVADSQANFVWHSLGDEDVDEAAVLDGLRACRVLVRSGRALGREGWARTTIGTAAENRRFLDALRALV